MGKFDDNKCKTNLKVSVHRMNLLKNQKAASITKQERDIADLLRQDKTELARVKIENVIRDDMIIQAFEIMELFVELLHTRMPMLKMQKTVPFDLKEAVCTIIYAAPRLEVKELHEVRKQFLYKYGEGLINDAMENRGNCVNPKIIHKLSVCAPENYLVFEYLGNIAKKYQVDWNCPYEHSSPLFDTSSSSLPPSIHQPMVPTVFAPSQFGNAPPSEENRFIPNGGQSVLPGTGMSTFPSVPTNGNMFPSVPSNNSNSNNPPPPYSPSNNFNESSFSFPSVPSNNSTSNNNSNFGMNFPSTPSNNSNNNFSSFPSVPSNSSNGGNFNFPSTPSNNSGGNVHGDSDFDDLQERFNRLKKK